MKLGLPAGVNSSVDDAPEKSRKPSIGYWLLAMTIGFLGAAILIPNFIAPRHMASQNACINNLRQIDAAKNLWAIEKHRNVGDAAVSNEVFSYIRGDIIPTCPAGGIYSINPIGQKPACSLGGDQHSLR